jgi:hypothetical protein
LGGGGDDGKRYLWLVVGVARGGEALVVRARAPNFDLAVKPRQIMGDLLIAPSGLLSLIKAILGLYDISIIYYM